LALPQSGQALTAASSFYLLFLAFKIATRPPLAAACCLEPAFAAGFLLAMTNPKAYLAIALVLAQAHLFDNQVLDVAVRVVLLTMMIILIRLCWLAAGASLSHLYLEPRSSRIINMALALILIGMTLVTI
jgi:threonine/homoserine/homoserine lactone efflux protein